LSGNWSLSQNLIDSTCNGFKSLGLAAEFGPIQGACIVAARCNELIEQSFQYISIEKRAKPPGFVNAIPWWMGTFSLNGSVNDLCNYSKSLDHLPLSPTK
jgi:hypothetical protein